MSRIHEALKKAEQERSTAPSQASVSFPTVDAQGSGPRSPEPAAAASSPEAVASNVTRYHDSPLTPPSILAPAPAFIRFEDLKARCSHPEWHLDPNTSVFGDPTLSKQGAEQFRTLRSRLHQARGNQKLKTLLVTSSVPGEGKTFVTINLAHAIVRQPDKRALIIDADLRRPRVHTVLGAPNAPGLTDYLRGDADEMAVMQHGPEGDLCMIPGGNEVTNPSELLSNGRLSALLDRLSPLFDWIILDSPPCLPVADASILAGMCDGVLLVVKAGSTPGAMAQRARQELQTRNVVGVVLNAIGEAHMHNSAYYDAYSDGYGALKAPTS